MHVAWPHAGDAHVYPNPGEGRWRIRDLHSCDEAMRGMLSLGIRVHHAHGARPLIYVVFHEC